MDRETQEINDRNKEILELTGHRGWPIVRKILTDKILDLQNVSEFIDIIQTGNATKLLKEMKAAKRAAEILFDFLREIEGNAQTAIDQAPKKTKSYLYIEDDSTPAVL